MLNGLHELDAISLNDFTKNRLTTKSNDGAEHTSKLRHKSYWLKLGEGQKKAYAAAITQLIKSIVKFQYDIYKFPRSKGHTD